MFLENIQRFVDQPIIVYEEEFMDLYIGERHGPFLQTV
jgi:hypothetical protein